MWLRRPKAGPVPALENNRCSHQGTRSHGVGFPCQCLAWGSSCTDTWANPFLLAETRWSHTVQQTQSRPRFCRPIIATWEASSRQERSTPAFPQLLQNVSSFTVTTCGILFKIPADRESGNPPHLFFEYVTFVRAEQETGLKDSTPGGLQAGVAFFKPGGDYVLGWAIGGQERRVGHPAQSHRARFPDARPFSTGSARGGRSQHPSHHCHLS